MADMDKEEMEAAVESILFASGEPAYGGAHFTRADGLLCL